MYVKFIGNWKELLPMGYQFQRLFARNYICYSKGEVDNRVWIWKKGKCIELSGANTEETCVIFKYLIQNDFKAPEKYNTFVINKELNTVEELDFEKHDFMCVFDFSKLKELTNDEKKVERKKFFDKFKEVYMNDIMVNDLKCLYEKCMIEIITEPK